VLCDEVKLEKKRERERLWRENNRDRVRASQEKWRLNNLEEDRANKRRHARKAYWDNPEKARAYGRAQGRRLHLKRKYGICEVDVQWLLLQQGGRCAVCQTGDFKPNVDHCHVSGRVRGVVCIRCNTLVGYLETTPPAVLCAATEYIKSCQN